MGRLRQPEKGMLVQSLNWIRTGFKGTWEGLPPGHPVVSSPCFYCRWPGFLIRKLKFCMPLGMTKEEKKKSNWDLFQLGKVRYTDKA